jgi:hypothetical protein
MAQQSPETEKVPALRRAYRDAADLALFLSDEMEMGRLLSCDGVAALRMFAGLMSLTEQLHG